MMPTIKRFGLTGILLASTLAFAAPQAASAQEYYGRAPYNNGYGYYDSPRAEHERHEWREHEFRERAWRQHEWREHERHEQMEHEYRYANPYYRNGYYNDSYYNGYYGYRR